MAVPLGDQFLASSHPQAEAVGSEFRIVRRTSGHYIVPSAEAPVLLNGHMLTAETRLSLGDSIRCGSREFALIHSAVD